MIDVIEVGKNECVSVLIIDGMFVGRYAYKVLGIIKKEKKQNIIH